MTTSTNNNTKQIQNLNLSIAGIVEKSQEKDKDVLSVITDKDLEDKIHTAINENSSLAFYHFKNDIIDPFSKTAVALKEAIKIHEIVKDAYFTSRSGEGYEYCKEGGHGYYHIHPHTTGVYFIIQLDLNALRQKQDPTPKSQKTHWWNKLLGIKSDTIPTLTAPDEPDETQIKLKTEFQEASKTIQGNVRTLGDLGGDLGFDMERFDDLMNRADKALSLPKYEVKTHPFSTAKRNVHKLANSLRQAVNETEIKQIKTSAEDKATLQSMFSITVTSVDKALQDYVVTEFDVDHQVMQIQNRNFDV